MDKGIKEYIEKNILFYAPTFHIFDVKVDKDGNPDTGDYCSEDDINREGYWHDQYNILTPTRFYDWNILVKTVEKRFPNKEEGA